MSPLSIPHGLDYKNHTFAKVLVAFESHTQPRFMNFSLIHIVVQDRFRDKPASISGQWRKVPTVSFRKRGAIHLK
ncbi:hypothetical protein MKW98_002955 [Papaver atlanticum]|uniref:Uncharacterized protein n=1 Tax=Papaver atlanticum TaxID=357466 RepID=A0AAD4XXZ0_9MAGN|nr:hypothetical protein MKW98_002955 [Papaver atlanticum]